ncbi:Uncharacterised protein [Mycobacterium tuberculosis]|nr:Uncharacterised protein [Mycobacterium tuberculosis]
MQASGPVVTTEAPAAGATAAAITRLKGATQRGKIGRSLESRKTANAKQRFCTKIMPTGATKIIHAMSLSNWTSSGLRFGLNAASSHMMSAMAKTVAPLVAAVR